MNGKFAQCAKCALTGILIVLMVAGCGILRPKAPKEEKDHKKNPPKALSQMEEDTDKMIGDLEDVREKRAKQKREQQHPSNQSNSGQTSEQTKQQGQDDDEDIRKPDQQNDQNEGQQKEKGQKEQGPQETPKPVPVPDWAELESTSESLHRNWNAYEPKAKSDGAMAETMKSFEEQLIALTEQIMARNEEKTLIAANSLYSHYPEFLKLYSHDQPPEVKEVKSLARQIILYGQQNQWEKTQPLLKEMKPAWQEAKVKISKPDSDLNSKIDAALYDFNYVVSKKKINLAKIKGDILIGNLEQIK